jgi:hypothetical protein
VNKEKNTMKIFAIATTPKTEGDSILAKIAVIIRLTKILE